MANDFMDPRFVWVDVKERVFVDAPTMGRLPEFALEHHHAIFFAPHLQKELWRIINAANFFLGFDLFVHDFEEDRADVGVLTHDNVVDDLVQLVERDDFHDFFEVLVRLVNLFVQRVDFV